MKHRVTVVPVLLLLLLTQGCPQKVTVPADPLQNLQTVAKALDDISVASQAAVKAVQITMPTNTENRRQIIAVLTKVLDADDAGLNITRSIATLAPADKASLTKLLEPVFAEFHKATESGLLGFKSAEAKAQVQPWIDKIATGISVIELVLEIRKAVIS